MPGNFIELPSEIVLHIISFVGLQEFRYLRQTCRRLLEIAELSPIKRKIVLTFYNRYITDETLPGIIFTNTICSHEKVRFNNSNFHNAQHFFKNLGQRIKSASFINTKFDKGQLCKILNNMYKIEKFKLKDVYCKSFRINNVINTNNIRSLSLLNVNMELYMPFLRCNYKKLVKFEFGFLTKETLEDINRLFDMNSKTIKNLLICGRLDEDRQLQLVKFINLLKLKKLKLNGNFSTETIVNIVKNQKSLQHLDISGVQPDNMMLIMKKICEQHYDLRVLKLTDCYNLCNESVKYISNLGKLKILHISQCSRLSDNGLIEGLARWELLNLEMLYMANLNLHINTIIHCTKMFPNLKVLNIAESIVDSSCTLLDAICDNLLYLEDLNINSIVKKNQEIPTSIQNLKHLRKLSVYSCKFSNQSLFNSMLLPNLKTLQIGYNSLITDKGIEKLAINCRAIENLELVACEKLTNISVDYILTNLSQLRTLNLNFSKRISSLILNNITEYKARPKMLSLRQNDQMGQNEILFGDLLILKD